ncbi:MAG TPA: hypothetical protein PLL02_00980 [Bacteroidales bacterium]|nr:hypothetical protein [Bacteroidales bacterium]
MGVVYKYEDTNNPYSTSNDALVALSQSNSPFDLVGNVLDILFSKPADAVNRGIGMIGNTITGGMKIKNERMLGLENIFFQEDESGNKHLHINVILIGVILLLFIYMWKK